MDPNTLNLDPDQGFWSNLDADLGLYHQFCKKKLKIIVEKNISLKSRFLNNYKNKMSPKEIFSVVDPKLFIPDPDPALNFPSSGSGYGSNLHIN